MISMLLPLAIGLALQVEAPELAAAPSEALGRFQMAYPFPAGDGATIIFQGDFDGRWQLYRLTTADGSIRRLHVSAADDTHPALSPDGRRLAFISNRDGHDDVYVLDLASGRARPVAPHPGKDGHPKWSADGAWLIFNRTFDPADRDGDRDSAIVRVRSDGRDLEVLSDSPRVETFPSFSPDGRSIVFIEWFPDANGVENRNGELIVLDLATCRRRNITNSPRFEAQPYWGPSGDWIYFAGAVETEHGREPLAHRTSPDGLRIERLTAIDGRAEQRPIPDRAEAYLYFNVIAEGRTLIARAALQSRGPDSRR